MSTVVTGILAMNIVVTRVGVINYYPVCHLIPTIGFTKMWNFKRHKEEHKARRGEIPETEKSMSPASFAMV
jgi:hypothetical protein